MHPPRAAPCQAWRLLLVPPAKLSDPAERPPARWIFRKSRLSHRAPLLSVYIYITLLEPFTFGLYSSRLRFEKLGLIMNNRLFYKKEPYSASYFRTRPYRAKS